MQATEERQVAGRVFIPYAGLEAVITELGGTVTYPDSPTRRNKKDTQIEVKGHCITAENNTMALIELLKLISEKGVIE